MPNPNDISTGSLSGATAQPSAGPSATLNPASLPFPTSSQTPGSAGIGAAAKNAADAAHDAVDEASHAGEDFVQRLVDSAHSAIDKLADVAGPAVGRLAGAFGNPSEKLSKLAGQAGDRKDEWVGDVRDIVRENPLAAVAAALAVGAIYIKLTSQPRRPRRDLDE